MRAQNPLSARQPACEHRRVLCGRSFVVFQSSKYLLIKCEFSSKHLSSLSNCAFSPKMSKVRSKFYFFSFCHCLNVKICLYSFKNIGFPTSEARCPACQVGFRALEAGWPAILVDYPTSEVRCPACRVGFPALEVRCLAFQVGSPASEARCRAILVGFPSSELGCRAFQLGFPLFEACCRAS